jgi:response regulator RpfG family c-di-GMP phosphodiesterase
MQGYYFARPMEAAQCTAALAQDKHLDVSAEKQDAERPTILLVDDDPLDLELVARALKPGGYEIIGSNDPYEALQILMERSVGIVISDHNMPRLSGTDFMVNVRNLYPETVRIVISGSSNLEVVAGAVNAAAIHKFLSKDWKPERLLAEVRDAYSRRTIPAPAAG